MLVTDLSWFLVVIFDVMWYSCVALLLFCVNGLLSFIVPDRAAWKKTLNVHALVASIPFLAESPDCNFAWRLLNAPSVTTVDAPIYVFTLKPSLIESPTQFYRLLEEMQVRRWLNVTKKAYQIYISLYLIFWYMNYSLLLISQLF